MSFKEIHKINESNFLILTINDCGLVIMIMDMHFVLFLLAILLLKELFYIFIHFFVFFFYFILK